MSSFNFQQLDFFGLPVVLNFAGSTKSKSKQGFVCTLIVAAFVLWAIYNSGREMVAKRNPKTITFDSFEQDPSRMVVSADTFPMAFGLLTPITQKYRNFIDETLYTPVVFQNIFRTTKFDNGTVKAERIHLPLDYERCTTDHFGKLKDSFSDIPLDSLYCFKKNQTLVEEISLQGTITSTVFNGFGISIAICKNSSTSPIICATPDRIKSVLTSCWLHIHYPQLAVNPQNVTNPDLIFRQSYVTMLSPTSYKTAVMNLGPVTITTDNGWLLEEKETQTFMKLNGVQEYLELTPNEDFMWNMLIQLDQVKTNYERSYVKIQDVLAQVQGLATTAILIVVIAMRPYSHLKFNESLINDIFNVKMAKRDKKLNKVKKRNIILQRKESKVKEPLSREKSHNVPQKVKNSRYEDLKIEGTAQSFENKKMKKTYDMLEVASPTSLLSKDSERMFFDKGNPRFEGQKPIQNLHSSKPTELLTLKNLLASKVSESKALSGQGIQLVLPKNTEESPFMTSPSKSDKRLNLERSLEGRGMQPHLSLAIEKPENIKVQILSEPENESHNISRDFVNLSLTSQTEREVANEEIKNKDLNPNTEGEQINREKGVPIKDKNTNKDQYYEENDKEDQTDNGDKKELDDRAAVFGQALEEEALSDTYEYESKNINISFWDYITSYVKKSDAVKEKMTILNKGMKNIEERLDIFNIMRKFREIDKLKALLLEDDQITLFDAMSKAELKAEEDNLVSRNGLFESVLKNPKFVEWGRKQDQIMASYGNVSKKQKKSKIDQRLLAIYNEDFKGAKPRVW